mmetsp:Transcript_53668/g.89035  ORF Transcript_53668/g.89035 Transcript_53668/m.89035 type:complete len:201 (+) Transcript_53668:1055-1657(+)
MTVLVIDGRKIRLIELTMTKRQHPSDRLKRSPICKHKIGDNIQRWRNNRARLVQIENRVHFLFVELLQCLILDRFIRRSHHRNQQIQQQDTAKNRIPTQQRLQQIRTRLIKNLVIFAILIHFDNRARFIPILLTQQRLEYIKSARRQRAKLHAINQRQVVANNIIRSKCATDKEQNPNQKEIGDIAQHVHNHSQQRTRSL